MELPKRLIFSNTNVWAPFRDSDSAGLEQGLGMCIFFFQNVRDCSHVRDNWKVPLLLTDHLFLYCGLLASQDYPVTLLFVPDDTLKTEILISVKCYTYVVLNKSSNKIIYFY